MNRTAHSPPVAPLSERQREALISGSTLADSGRSRTWPIDDSTTYPPPRKREMVLAFAGDSTTTRLGPPRADRGLAVFAVRGGAFLFGAVVVFCLVLA